MFITIIIKNNDTENQKYF